MNTNIQPAGTLSFLTRGMNLSYATALTIVLLTVLLTHIPMPFNNLANDDFLIRANIAGDEMLFAKGMVQANPAKGLMTGLSDAFHFFSAEKGTLTAYKEYGNLPWWSAVNPKMSPWRPITAFTHWLDYNIAPDSFQFQTFHSLIYLTLYAYCTFRLFWRLSSRSSAAVLATLLLVVDYSHFINFSWVAARNVFIAGAIGCCMLEQFIVWRQTKCVIALIFSLGLFAAALLCAESSIALAGYLFAYLLFVEKATLQKMAVLLLPFALIVLVWRTLYSTLGYGAGGISLYVDPGSSPTEFLAALVSTMPALFAGTATTLDGVIPSLSPPLQPWAIALSMLIALLGLWLIKPILKRDANACFMLIGSVLAAIPASALVSGGSRSGIFISVGFFWILSLLLHDLLSHSRTRLARLFARSLLTVHLVLPALIAFLVSSMLLPVHYQSDMQYESVAKVMQQAKGRRALVVVNSRAPIREFYLPFTWRYLHGTVPESLNLLAPGMASFYLTRRSAKEYELVAPVGLPLTADTKTSSLDGSTPIMSEVYYLQMLQGLITAADFRYKEGDIRTSGDITITIMKTINGAPSQLSIQFDAAADPDSMAWQWYDWEDRQYRAMDSLNIEETRFFPGPLDLKKKNMVDLCWECETKKPTDSET